MQSLGGKSNFLDYNSQYPPASMPIKMNCIKREIGQDILKIGWIQKKAKQPIWISWGKNGQEHQIIIPGTFCETPLPFLPHQVTPIGTECLFVLLKASLYLFVCSAPLKLVLQNLNWSFWVLQVFTEGVSFIRPLQLPASPSQHSSFFLSSLSPHPIS